MVMIFSSEPILIHYILVNKKAIALDDGGHPDPFLPNCTALES